MLLIFATFVVVGMRPMYDMVFLEVQKALEKLGLRVLGSQEALVHMIVKLCWLLNSCSTKCHKSEVV